VSAEEIPADSTAGNSATGKTALAVAGLSVAHGNVVAVHDATFTVAEGDACAIVGPNSNGKSSTLMGVTGMVRRRGAVEIFGAPARNGDVRWAARHGLTLVPERRQLYPDLTTEDNCPSARA
jgi:branched-chain amino acid transport system ATP-binding protein